MVHLRYALTKSDRVAALRKLDAGVKPLVMHRLASFAFEDYSTSAVNIGNGYVPLGRFGLMVHTVNGMYVYRMFGIKIQNGNASVQGGKYLGREQYAIFGNNTVTSLSLPVLPDMYV